VVPWCRENFDQHGENVPRIGRKMRGGQIPIIRRTGLSEPARRASQEPVQPYAPHVNDFPTLLHELVAFGPKLAAQGLCVSGNPDGNLGPALLAGIVEVTMLSKSAVRARYFPRFRQEVHPKP